MESIITDKMLWFV